jgi:hypothetical protein
MLVNINSNTNHSYDSYIDGFNINIDKLYFINNIELRKNYARLLYFYPLGDKKEKTLKNLKSNNKLPFLFSHLVKTYRNNFGNDGLLKKTLYFKKLHNDAIKKIMSKKEIETNLKILFLSKDYDGVFEILLNNKKRKHIKHILTLLSNLMIKKLVIRKIKLLNKNNVGHIKEMEIRDAFNKSNDKINIIDISLDLDEEIKKWNKFIKEEVDNRVDRILKSKLTDIMGDKKRSENLSVSESDGVKSSRRKKLFSSISLRYMDEITQPTEESRTQTFSDDDIVEDTDDDLQF